MRLLLFSVLFLAGYISICGQSKLDIDFASPLGIPLVVTGTFGELRTNHFHTGLDFRTNKSNIPVYSIYDGYISRINISPYGYGKALYITHRNGYTSVYAHLTEFNTEVESYIQQLQYAQQTFAIDVQLQEDEIVVRRGQQVGLSGNSGGSGGPHLHFEIRESNSDIALNPLLFNFKYKITDSYKPTIQAVKIYEFDENYELIQSYYKWIKRDKAGRLNMDTIRINAPFFAVGVKTTDRCNADPNPNGVYSVQLFRDDMPYYKCSMNALDFTYKKHYNSHIDFPDDKKNVADIHKCYIDEGNKLEIYENVYGRGIQRIEPLETCKIQIQAFDAHDNAENVELFISRNLSESFAPQKFCTYSFSYNAVNLIAKEGIEVQFPLGTFFTDICFNFYEQLPYSYHVYSQVYQLHNEYTPLAQNFNIKIGTKNLPENLTNKATIVYENMNKKKAIKTTYSNGFCSAESNELGKYYVTIDTVAPKVNAINFKPNVRLPNISGLRFRIDDELSGINTYNVYVNDSWILCEYDAKNDLLFSRGLKNFNLGENRIRIIVSDVVGNITEKEYTVIY